MPCARLYWGMSFSLNPERRQKNQRIASRKCSCNQAPCPRIHVRDHISYKPSTSLSRSNSLPVKTSSNQHSKSVISDWQLWRSQAYTTHSLENYKLVTLLCSLHGLHGGLINSIIPWWVGVTMATAWCTALWWCMYSKWFQFSLCWFDNPGMLHLQYCADQACSMIMPSH